jgi:hypothetical protein
MAGDKPTGQLHARPVAEEDVGGQAEPQPLREELRELAQCDRVKTEVGEGLLLPDHVARDVLEGRDHFPQFLDQALLSSPARLSLGMA